MGAEVSTYIHPEVEKPPYPVPFLQIDTAKERAARKAPGGMNI
jgi:hypothetical protein